MEERQLLLSSLFKTKPVHNAVRWFSCYTSICYEFQEIEKVRTFLVRMLSCLWPNRHNNFLFECFGKVYASVEDLAVRRM